MNRRSGKQRVPNPPASPVVGALMSISHFPDLCDGWYKADDIVTIVTRIFALSEDQKQQFTPGMLKNELENDPATSSVHAASRREIGIYERTWREHREKFTSYYYFISSTKDMVPLISRDSRWKKELEAISYFFAQS